MTSTEKKRIPLPPARRSHEKNLKQTIILCLMLGANVMSSGAQIPKGWFPAGSHPKEYEMNLDRSTAHSGKAGASVKCVVPRASGFGTLMQTMQAGEYRGKRLRFSGYVSSDHVKEWAGL